MSADFFRLEYIGFDENVLSVRVPENRFWVNAKLPVFEFDFYYQSQSISENDIRVIGGGHQPLSFSIRRKCSIIKPLRAIEHVQGFTISLMFPVPGPVIVGIGDDNKHAFSLLPRTVFPAFLYDATFTYGKLVTDKPFENFVETGTLFGHTCVAASHWFKRVYTIELSEKLWTAARDAFGNVRNIEFLLGNSGQVLPSLAAKLTGATVFFLDAHWSGDGSVDWGKSKFSGYPVDTAHLGDGGQDSVNSEKQVPLLDEIEGIYENCVDECLVIIDDWESVGRKGRGFIGEDWSHISRRGLLDLFARKKRTQFHFNLDARRYIVGLTKL